MSNGGNNGDRESAVPLSRFYSEGDVISGKYLLERLLGEGGMGMVWLARNEALESRVAIKVIRGDVHHPEAADRLLTEARAAARLEHRGIVRVFDFGRSEHGDPFIVMELLDGRSLGDVLEQRTRLSAVQAVQTLLPVVDALAFAHRQGIVHRDLKPDNIFLAKQTKRTQPKVVDFGIAKVESGRRDLTRNGTVLGSPGYMSPEQARGTSDVDHRADVWAVCVVLYEAITGCIPFAGENYNAMMRAIIEDEVVPITDLAAGDAALWAILERGLCKDRNARWSSMRDLGRALAEWLIEHGVDRDIAGESLVQLWLTDADEGMGRDVFSSPPPSSDAALVVGRGLREQTTTLSTPPDGLAPPGSLRSPRVPAFGPRSTPPASSHSVPDHIEVEGRPRRGLILAVAAAACIVGFVAVSQLRSGDAELAPATTPAPAGRAIDEGRGASPVIPVAVPASSALPASPVPVEAPVAVTAAPSASVRAQGAPAVAVTARRPASSVKRPSVAPEPAPAAQSPTLKDPYE